MISVIIPAHNEEAVLPRGLAALTTGAALGELEVIVVPNGCRDRTADVARAFGTTHYPVTVIETAQAGKANALNVGDAAATGFPRIYIDADVVLPLEAARALVARLAKGDMVAVAPRAQLALGASTWAVRAFYDVDRRLPSYHVGIGGSGVYALSAAGRARFGAFPEITGDDAFIRRLFKPEERMSVDGAYSVVTPPRNLAGLVAIKTRSHFGNYEINYRLPHLTCNVGSGNHRALAALAAQPALWPRLGMYAYVKVAARIRGYWRFRFGNHQSWERDETSRINRSSVRDARHDIPHTPGPGENFARPRDSDRRRPTQ